MAAKSIPMADLEGEPSAMVAQHVNVITGDFNDFQLDLVVPGIEPLKVERSFSGSTKYEGSLCAGWNLNLFGRLTEGSAKIDGEKYFSAAVHEGHGATTIYETPKKDKKRDNVPLSKSVLKKGLTNTSSGYIGGQTNLKNTKVQKVAKDIYHLQNGAGGYKAFRLSPELDYTYRLIRDVKPSGNSVNYHYYPNPVKDVKFRHAYFDHLCSVEVKSYENKVLGSVTFSKKEKEKKFKKNPHYDVTTCDGRTVQYHFEKPKHNIRVDCILTKVERANGTTIEYEYIDDERDEGMLISRKSEPEGRDLLVGYYKKGKNEVGDKVIEIDHKRDPRTDRVAYLEAPVGWDRHPVITHRFFYKCNRDKKDQPLDGSTKVLDAYDNKTIYAYDKNHRLGFIERYQRDSLYSKERLFWGNDESEQSTCLITRSLESANGEPIFVRSYQYDRNGNVLHDDLYGNLTGKCQGCAAVSSKGNVNENGSERYRRNFAYTNDGFNLIWWTGDDDHAETYQYVPGSNRMSCKFTGSHSRFYRREFYEYHADASISKEIIDDGQSHLVDDMAGVSERLIKYYIPHQSMPYSVPETIIEKCLDLSTGNELLIHRTVNSYSFMGLITRQEHYDANNNFAYTLHWEYDRMGNVTKEVDAIGGVTVRKYDENGNCIYEQGPNPERHRKFFYDCANRLVKEEEVHADGVRRATSYSYNLLNQRTAVVDCNGNKTFYDYDAFGRNTCIQHPLVQDASMKKLQPKEIKSYDLMGNVTGSINPCGHEKKMSYTIRGKLADIIHSDGSAEKMIYNLDGTLRQTIAANGSVTTYTYDALDRIIQTETRSAQNELLAETSTDYNGFHVLRETNAKGQTTEYSYYPDGKLKAKRCGTSYSTYAYDSLGRLNRTVDHYDDEPESVVVTVQEYDLLNRVTSERTEDFYGTILKSASYRYDVDGNVCEVRNGDGSVTSTIYDSHGTPVVSIDADGNKTFTSCRYDYVNSLGQFVEYTEVTDPLGNITAITKDAMGRTASIEKKNTFGQLTQKQESYYDASGNRKRIVDTVIGAGSERQIVTLMEYDSLGHCIEMHEAYGSPDQKKTVFAYNTSGQKTAHIKNDGTSVDYDYDALGRLITVRSGDGTLEYRYEYDYYGNPVKITDVANHTVTLRDYDDAGRIIREQLGNGLDLSFTYDGMGRPLLVTLPDGTGFCHSYSACTLKSMKRLKADGSIAYEHRYDKYDAAGRVAEMQLIDQAGSVKYEYDNLGRLRKATAAKWSEDCSNYDVASNLLEKSVNDNAGCTAMHYAYDDLYQLTSEDGPEQHAYTYDSHHNRINKDGREHIHNNLHQLTDDGEAQYAYDQNGNLIRKTTAQETCSYSYDALDRLVFFSDETKQVRYLYDDNNRRLKKTIYKKEAGEWVAQETIRYLYFGQNEIGAADKDGKIIEFRMLGVGKGAEIGATVAIEMGQQVYATINNHAGHVACLIDPHSGDMVESYRYTAFGEELFEEALSPWRFAGKRVDNESGLVFFGRRYYDPATGRWTTPDPLGRDGGSNLYAYVLNSPLTHFDLYGLYGLCDFWQDSGLSQSFSVLGRDIGRGISMLGNFWRQECPIPFLRDIAPATNYLFTNGTLRGYTWHHEEFASFNGSFQGKNLPHHHLLYTNGMSCSPEEVYRVAQQYSEMYGGITVDYTYIGNHGKIIQFLEYLMLSVGIPTPASINHANLVNGIFSSDPQAQILDTGHSLGGLVVNNLHMLLSTQKLQHIVAQSFGSASMLSKKYFAEAVNYVSRHDPVPLFADPIGFCKSFFSRDIHMEFIQSNTLPFDHFMLGDTYKNQLKTLGYTYTKTYQNAQRKK